MQVVVCSKCGVKNRVEESRLGKSEAKCGRCGATLSTTTGQQDALYSADALRSAPISGRKDIV